MPSLVVRVGCLFRSWFPGWRRSPLFGTCSIFLCYRGQQSRTWLKSRPFALLSWGLSGSRQWSVLIIRYNARTFSISRKTSAKFQACWSISLNISWKTITKRVYGSFIVVSQFGWFASLLKRSTRDFDPPKHIMVTESSGAACWGVVCWGRSCRRGPSQKIAASYPCPIWLIDLHIIFRVVINYLQRVGAWLRIRFDPDINALAKVVKPGC